MVENHPHEFTKSLISGEAERLKQKAVEQLEGSGLVVRYRALPEAGVAGLVQAARQESAGTLVLGVSPRLKEETLQDLLERLDCAVLLVR